ncbi:MAG: aminotransferase class V-fold PLP-dependent enzyme [Flammeovirgaceae bacterium]
MPKKYFLTPGPSELYYTVADHMRTALSNGIPSISHRSKAFEEIFKHAVTELRKLLDIPTDYHVVFTNSANEIWERLLQNCVEKESFHLVHGSFSKKFAAFAKQLNKKAVVHEVPFGEAFDISQVEIPASAELIAAIANETSAGVATLPESIYQLKEQNPEALLVVDAVSAVPFIEVDFSKIDSLYFSVQKGMGLPAGLGVWIFNDRCVQKAETLKQKGQAIGTYHSIPSLVDKAAKNQTPATPNVLGIYLLGKVCEDMNRRTVAVIRQEMIYKAALIYGLLERHPDFEPFVQDKKHRSQTVIVANILNGGTSSEVIEVLEKSGLTVGTGYGENKQRQIRIANFPTHSKELFERLYDLLEPMRFSASKA